MYKYRGTNKLEDIHEDLKPLQEHIKNQLIAGHSMRFDYPEMSVTFRRKVVRQK